MLHSPVELDAIPVDNMIFRKNASTIDRTVLYVCPKPVVGERRTREYTLISERERRARSEDRHPYQNADQLQLSRLTLISAVGNNRSGCRASGFDGDRCSGSDWMITTRALLLICLSSPSPRLSLILHGCSSFRSLSDHPNRYGIG